MEEFSDFIGFLMLKFLERSSEDKLCFETNFTVFKSEMIFWGVFFDELHFLMRFLI